MNGKIQLGLLLFFACSPLLLDAQQVNISQQDMEDLMYRNESDIIPETILGTFNDPGQPPLDLNNSSPEELELSGLFTRFQLYNLLQYRAKYGALYSIHELSALPGFHRSKVLELEPFICLQQVPINKRKKNSKHFMMMDIARTFPASKGYSKEMYPGISSGYMGTPLKTCIRIRSQPGKNLRMALTYEKDAGELFLYENRPQFLSSYLSYYGEGVIRHLVIGNFRLNQGLGLVNGAGFMHQPGNFVVNSQSISRIKPYASKTEALYNRGFACHLGQNKIQFLIWASHCRINLSPSALTENPDGDNWLNYQRTSGLFRNSDELECRDLAFRVHTGIQSVYRYKQLAVGIMSSTEWLYPGGKALELLEKKPVPAFHQKSSLHANWQKNQIQVFGELSTAGYNSLACLVGSLYQFNDFIRGTILLHHYGTDYKGSLPSSYASGSTISNEQGAAFFLQTETGKYMTAELCGELFRYLSPRYQTRVPSKGYSLNLSLYGPGNKPLQWKTRFVSKTWQHTPEEKNAKVRPLYEIRTSRLDGQLIYLFRDLLKWQSRLVISYLSKSQEVSLGYAAVQQICFGHSRTLKITAQYLLFQVSDWENRIYLYEPGVYYSFNFPCFYGCGHKTTLLLTLKLLRNTSFSVKISTIEYKDRAVIGSGLDQVDGNQKWEAGIQLRLSF
jgi:hypothetical protein